MYNKIFENLEQQLPKDTLDDFKHRTLHLAIFSEPYLTYMLEGKKTIESRFAKNRIMPYEQVSKDDIVLVKKNSGNVLAYFTIKDVEFINISEVFPLSKIKEIYNDRLCLEDLFWRLKRHSNYATLITIDKITMLKPFSIGKTGRLGWIKLKP